MWYRIIALMVVLAVATGCVWMVDDSVVFESPAERMRAIHAEVEAANGIDEFEDGWVNGCMALIYFTAPESGPMPFDDALRLCADVRTLAGDDRMEPSNAPVTPVEPVIECRGQCI